MTPRRDDGVAVWLKDRRDAEPHSSTEYAVLDELLDLYRLHADTGVPLDQHACEGRCDDCPA